MAKTRRKIDAAVKVKIALEAMRRRIPPGTTALQREARLGLLW